MRTVSIKTDYARCLGGLRLPVLEVMGVNFQFYGVHGALSRWRRAREHRFAWRDGLIHLEVCGKRLLVLPFYAMMIEAEREEWNDYYLQGFEPGMTVLDVGAGCGETAIFYLEHGANKVIAVEPGQEAFELLKKNTEGLNVECINESFRPEHLSFYSSFCKIDCEGCEMVLLRADKIPTSVIEIHDGIIGKKNSADLIHKFNLRLLKGANGRSIYRTPSSDNRRVSLLNAQGDSIRKMN